MVFACSISSNSENRWWQTTIFNSPIFLRVFVFCQDNISIVNYLCQMCANSEYMHLLKRVWLYKRGFFLKYGFKWFGVTCQTFPTFPPYSNFPTFHPSLQLEICSAQTLICKVLSILSSKDVYDRPICYLQNSYSLHDKFINLELH